MRCGVGLVLVEGLIVAECVPKGPAYCAGVQPGDVLQSVGGVEVGRSIDDAASLLIGLQGTSTVLTVRRAGEVLQMPMRRAAIPDSYTFRIDQASPSDVFDAEVVDDSPFNKGNNNNNLSLLNSNNGVSSPNNNNNTSLTNSTASSNSNRSIHGNNTNNNNNDEMSPLAPAPMFDATYSSETYPNNNSARNINNIVNQTVTIGGQTVTMSPTNMIWGEHILALRKGLLECVPLSNNDDGGSPNSNGNQNNNNLKGDDGVAQTLALEALAIAEVVLRKLSAVEESLRWREEENVGLRKMLADLKKNNNGNQSKINNNNDNAERERWETQLAQLAHERDSAVWQLESQIAATENERLEHAADFEAMVDRLRADKEEELKTLKKHIEELESRDDDDDVVGLSERTMLMRCVEEAQQARLRAEKDRTIAEENVRQFKLQVAALQRYRGINDESHYSKSTQTIDRSAHLLRDSENNNKSEQDLQQQQQDSEKGKTDKNMVAALEFQISLLKRELNRRGNDTVSSNTLEMEKQVAAANKRVTDAETKYEQLARLMAGLVAARPQSAQLVTFPSPALPMTLSRPDPTTTTTTASSTSSNRGPIVSSAPIPINNHNHNNHIVAIPSLSSTTSSSSSSTSISSVIPNARRPQNSLLV